MPATGAFSGTPELYRASVEAHTEPIAHEVAVVIPRRRQSKGTDQQQLSRRGFEKVRAAYDFGNLHRGVVGDNRELIRGHIIATPHDEIAEVATGDVALRSEMRVVEADGFAIGNAKAPVHTGGRLIALSVANLFAAAAGIKRLVVAFVRRRG